MAVCLDCPRMCGADRTKNTGDCGASAVPLVARAALHFWEEPPVSGSRGSGTVFFSGCNLSCVFCQNYDISAAQKGKQTSADELAQIYLSLQAQGAHNINLVTPSPHMDAAIGSLRLARERGLRMPVVWNSNAYERVETLRRLEGLVDVYLPDCKYVSPALSKAYSDAENYFEVARDAIAEMHRQVGLLRCENGVVQRGLLVRHLVLPGCADDTRRVLDALAELLPLETSLSIMRQYTPAHLVLREDNPHKFLARRLTAREYERAVDYALALGFTNIFAQSGKSADSAYTPPFDGTGV